MLKNRVTLVANVAYFVGTVARVACHDCSFVDAAAAAAFAAAVPGVTPIAAVDPAEAVAETERVLGPLISWSAIICFRGSAPPLASLNPTTFGAGLNIWS